MPHRRLWRNLSRDPDRRRRFIVAAVVGMAMFTGSIWWILANVNRNEHAIAERPTQEQLLAALAGARRDQRRACRVVNRRFVVLAGVLEGQRPNPTTTSYYATHPAELARARRYFDRTLAALAPRDCRAAYPPPTPRDVEKLGKGPDAAVRGSPRREASALELAAPTGLAIARRAPDTAAAPAPGPEA